MTLKSKVSLRGLYKIFGSDDKEVLPHVKAGMGKEELLASHQHVLGLQDINVEMQAGKITVVMGLSGSGKSTLIRHLNRLIEPTDGEILVDGVDIMHLTTLELRHMRQKKCRWYFKNSHFCPTEQFCKTPPWPWTSREWRQLNKSVKPKNGSIV